MKKLFTIIFFALNFFAAKAQKNTGVVLSPGASAICNCDGFAISTNMLIEGNASAYAAYILELQIPQVAGCSVTLDSLYFFTAPGGLAQDRFNSFSEFAKIQEKLSSDKKWRTIRYRIPKRLFVHAPIIKQPLTIFYKTRVGTRVCTPKSDIKITDELL